MKKAFEMKQGTAIIPRGTRVISKDAFRDRTDLVQVVLPDTVEIIEETAFAGCHNLIRVVLPKSLKTIGKWAFYDCSSLEKISIPASVTAIGTEAFANCEDLKFIRVSKNNEFFDSREYCNAIINSNSNTLIVGCQSSTIPPTVIEIGMGAFTGCSHLKKVVIPKNVQRVNAWAFYGCSQLSSIQCLHKNTFVGIGAFNKIQE